MKKLLFEEQALKFSVQNQNPAVLIYLVIFPFLLSIFYFITTFVL